MKVVLVSGWKGSGKDTLAENLINNHNFKRVAFADPLKDMVAEEYDIPRSHLDDRKYKETAILKYPINPQDSFSRQLSEMMIGEFRDTHGVAPVGFTYIDGQFYGKVEENGETLTVRVYHTPRSLAILKGSTNRFVTPSYWVERAVNDMKANPNGLYVISDLRYKSEVGQVRNLIGPENTVTIRVNRFETTQSVDPSERDLDDYSFDHVISNRGSIEDLYRKSEEILKLK